jgi:hypothetical protein
MKIIGIIFGFINRYIKFFFIIFIFVAQNFEIRNCKIISAQSTILLKQIHIFPAFIEIPASEITTIFFLTRSF